MSELPDYKDSFPKWHPRPMQEVRSILQLHALHAHRGRLAGRVVVAGLQGIAFPSGTRGPCRRRLRHCVRDAADMLHLQCKAPDQSQLSFAHRNKPPNHVHILGCCSAGLGAPVCVTTPAVSHGLLGTLCDAAGGAQPGGAGRRTAGADAALRARAARDGKGRAAAPLLFRPPAAAQPAHTAHVTPAQRLVRSTTLEPAWGRKAQRAAW